MKKTRKGYPVYPLTAAQRLHYYSMKYCPKKQVLNIGSSLTIQVELDWGILQECIHEAVQRCDSMRIRFTHDTDGQVYQYVIDPETPQPVEFFDFSRWTMEAAEAKLEEWTSEPLARDDSPMHRIVMIKMPDGYQGVYIMVDHMVMDAQALIVMFKDIIELYCHKVYEGIEYPKEMVSYLKLLEKDLAYEQGTTAAKRDREFFENLITSSEPVFADIYGPGKLLAEQKSSKNPALRAVTNTSDNVDANLANFHLEEEPSMRLLQFCEKYQVSMTCLLLMGLRTYLQKENDLDDISLVTTIARRATLLEKRGGGSRIHCFPFRTIVAKEESFLEGVYRIRDGQNQYFRHANYSPSEYYAFRKKYYGLADGQTYEPLALTYQPLTMKYDGPGLENLGDIQYKTKRYTNGVCAHSLYLTVSHRTLDNGLDFCFEYQTGVVTREKLESMYYYLCRILFKGVEDPAQTVGDIIEWA